MEVLTRSKCTECGGSGIVTSHIWNEFFEIESESNRAWEQEEVNEWFRGRGYGTLPPEEPTCFECEGTGKIEKWIDVHEILEKVNIIG